MKNSCIVVNFIHDYFLNTRYHGPDNQQLLGAHCCPTYSSPLLMDRTLGYRKVTGNTDVVSSLLPLRQAEHWGTDNRCYTGIVSILLASRCTENRTIIGGRVMTEGLYSTCPYETEHPIKMLEFPDVFKILPCLSNTKFLLILQHHLHFHPWLRKNCITLCGIPQKQTRCTLTKVQRVKADSCFFIVMTRRFDPRCGS